MVTMFRADSTPLLQIIELACALKKKSAVGLSRPLRVHTLSQIDRSLHSMEVNECLTLQSDHGKTNLSNRLWRVAV